MKNSIAIFVLTCWLGLRPAFADQRPNILFIFSDDHAQHAISAYGSKVNQTPHLDRLARQGARFTNSFVTNSICTPSRATLLTGQYSHVNGVPVFNRFDGSRDHAAKHLQAGGYHTGMIGKWHLGSDPTGFDRWIVLPGQGSYSNPQFLLPGKKKLTIEGHCTDVTTDLGIEWIKTRPKDKPFFLMLHQKAPHRAWDPAPRHISMFKDKTIPEPETLWDDYATRPTALPINEQTVAKDLTRRDLKLTPPADLKGPALQRWMNEKPMELEVDGQLLKGRDLVKWKYQKYMRDYLACVQGVDDGVGKVLDYLDESGLAENTIVIYSADNGWYLGDLGLYDKRFMYEPGLNVPLIARGPGIKQGITPSQFVANIDLAPTFLDLAGLPVPDAMQGRSIAPLLRGESPKDWRSSIYYRYYHDPGHHNTVAHLGARTATHKLIHYWKQDVYELFDLKADPHEQRNLLFSASDREKPEVAAKFTELKAELQRLKQYYKDTDDLYADPATWPAGSADGPFDAYQPSGIKSVAEAIAMTDSSQSTNLGFQFEKQDTSLRLMLDGKPIGQFVYQDEKIRRPHFANLTLPEGTQVTRNQPPIAGVDAVDHDTMHPGVWLAFGDVSGVDFWRNKGSIVHARFVDDPQVVDGRLSFATECQLNNEQGQAIGRLMNKFRLSLQHTPAVEQRSEPATSGWLLMWDATIIADQNAITLGDQEEMGFGARVATSITEKKGGRILNSNGQATAGKSWGQPATWCDYSGTIDGKSVGVTLLASPKNRLPCWWHNRDYGLMVANPFGRKAMKQGEKSEIKIEPGQSLTLRFGAYIHRGSSNDYSSLLSAVE